VLVAVIASYLQSGSRKWHPSGRPRMTYKLLLITSVATIQKQNLFKLKYIKK